MSLADQVLAHVSAHPGATSREVAEAVFGECRARSVERQRVCVLLRSLVDSGKIGKTTRPKTDKAIPCFAYWPIEEYEPRRDAVMLTHRQRFLMRHVLRSLIDAGTLGPPSAALLEHLEAEEKRIDP